MKLEYFSNYQINQIYFSTTFVTDVLGIIRYKLHEVLHVRCSLDGIKPQTKSFPSLLLSIAIGQIATSGRD